MRNIARTVGLLGIVVASLAAGDDAGVIPRAKPTDYPVHGNAKAAELAAVVVAPEQVKRLFSADISKHYIVVEVAVYPESGRSFDVDLFDFELRSGDRSIRPSRPRDVASPWPERKYPLDGRGPNVTTETGVIVGHGTDPVTGRPRTDVSTWEGVGVSNYPNNPPPPPQGNPDQGAIEAQVRRMALPLGPTSAPVAGYLYFAQDKRKRDALTLKYSTDDESVDLNLPK
jgi:hypothetical protein